MSSGIKLATGSVVIVGMTLYMAYVGASASWQYYATTDECLTQMSELAGCRVRVSGRVSPGTLQVTADRSEAEFALEGSSGRLAVICQGPLPDDLTEEKEVVVEGLLGRDRVLRGDKLLTRCASKYEATETFPSSVEQSSQDAESGP